MPESSGSGSERVNAFRVDEAYLFRHYFEEEPVFAKLRNYYQNHEYRFAVPADEYAGVQAFLERFGYHLVEVERPAEYAVVKRKYTDHPEVLFRESVLRRSAGNHNCFVMTDGEAVDRAVSVGATRIGETDVDIAL